MAHVVDSFWSGKRVFLTGHTGFKGTWLSIWLHKMGAKVTGYSLSPEDQSMFNELSVKSLIASHVEDIRDYSKLTKAMKEAQPDIVIHMAAQALVKYSYQHPLETFQTNVVGTANILEACRHIDSLRAVVSVTSDKCYENVEKISGYKETDPMGGHDPYSSSKGCAELVTSSFKRSFFNTEKVGIASARAGNVIGGGDWAADRLVPDIFRAIISKNPVVIRNPKALRPWQHVLEPLSGYLVLAQQLYENPNAYSEGFNFGPNEDEAQTVEYVVSKIISQWGQGSKYEILQNYKGPHEANFLKLDVTKSLDRLSWKPTWNLDLGIRETTAWYQEFIENKSNIHDFTIKQINKFQEDSRTT